MSLRNDDPILRSMLDGMVQEVSEIEQALRANFDAATKRAEQAAKTLTDEVQAARRALQVAQDEIATLNRRLEHANAGVAAGKQAQAKVEALQKELEAARERHRDAMLEAEGRHSERMAAMMERQGDQLRMLQEIPAAIDAALARLSNQVAGALGARPPTKATPPPTYEMRVVARDGNNRPTTVRLTPAKE